MSLVVNLDVPDDVILGRISDRWVHLPSGRVYNLSYNPPKVAGHDDETGEPLTKRPDDNPVRVHVPHGLSECTHTMLPCAGNLRSAPQAVLCIDVPATCVLQHQSS